MTTPATPTKQLNDEQRTALTAIEQWLDTPDDPFFVLSGGAGTGKTFTVGHLTDKFRGRVVFCAPTNKAVKVIRRAVTTQEYKPECRTIYSLLGLRMVANGEIKELSGPQTDADGDKLDLSIYKLIVIDEGSMVGEKLRPYIVQATRNYKVKVLFMGDSAQLPPVGEDKSWIWALPGSAHLSTVMRHDNQILTLATAIRGQVTSAFPKINLASDHDTEGGVWRMDQSTFRTRILAAAEAGYLSIPDGAKVIAWRNVTVDSYNSLIRKCLYGSQSICPWLPGDRVLFSAPASDLDDKPMCSTDDEGQIDRVEEEYHPLEGMYKVWRLTITLDDSRLVIAYALHPASFGDYTRKVEELAQAARADAKKWRFFWEFKEKFHQLRHAYAITAHRSQGSTYRTALVDFQDILLNRARQEAFKCLYVACTRPTTNLILGG